VKSMLVTIGDVCLRAQGDLQPMAPEQWSTDVPLPSMPSLQFVAPVWYNIAPTASPPYPGSP
jgi:hypothetical protein